MQFRHLLLPLLALVFLGAARKPDFSIRFHTMAREQDGPPFVTMVEVGIPPRKVFIKKIPEISETDIDAIYPFQVADGTMGCALKLDDHGQIKLDTLSMEHKGSILVCIVNGRVVTEMQIDKRVADGIIMIPSGLTPQDMMVIRKHYRVMGSKKE